MDRRMGERSDNEGSDFSWRCNLAAYRPEELEAYVEGRELVIAGQHREQQDTEYLERNVTRRVSLPTDIDTQSIRCLMDQHGRLEILAHRDNRKANLPEQQKQSLMINVFRNY
ncbi:small HSP21-like protein [Aphelenchoides avenae]|nr:small HSP21-like protein [Aphelenchus avenae]